METERIEVVDCKSAISYLENVIAKWDAFCEDHPSFTKAIRFVLQELYRPIDTSSNKCVMCGVEIPEGRQVCPSCENETLKCDTHQTSWKGKFFEMKKENESLKQDYIELDLECRELRTELDKELAEHEEFTQKAKAEIELLSKVISSSKRKTKILEMQREIERLKLSLREQCTEDHRLGLENDKIVLRNAELQKQVGELKKENKELSKRLVDEFEKFKVVAYEKVHKKAVKDAAKEILQITIQLSDMCESFYEFQNRLIDLIEINYDVNVETETIISAKAVEVDE